MSLDFYFAGSQNQLAEEYMMKNGCNRLLSYYNDKSIINKWLEHKKQNPNCTNKFLSPRWMYVTIFYRNNPMRIFSKKADLSFAIERAYRQLQFITILVFLHAFYCGFYSNVKPCNLFKTVRNKL